MKDRSGSSIMDAKTQVTRVSGVSILDTAKYPLESNYCLALIREHNDANDNALFNTAIAAEVILDANVMAAVDLAREAGNAPNTVLATACASDWPAPRGRRPQGGGRADRPVWPFRPAQRRRGRLRRISSIKAEPAQLAALTGKTADPKAEAMLAGLKARGVKSVFVDYLRSLKGHPTADAVLAAITTTICWGALMKKKITRNTARNFPWYARLFATIIGASVDGSQHKNGQLLRRPDRGTDQQVVLDRDRLSGAAGRDADAGEAVPVPVPAGPDHLQRPRHDLRAGLPRARCPPTARKRRSACRSTRR